MNNHVIALETPIQYIIYIFIGIAMISFILLIIFIFVKLRNNKNTNYNFNGDLDYAGFTYDEKQDIFYSTMDAWQKKYGYCNLYDEIAPLFNLIFDRETIYFDYGNKRWLIEFWKGQYGMTTGGEVGIYNIDSSKYNNSLLKSEVIYQSVSDEEMLPMSFQLFKNNQELFTREDTHWWLTGFKVGEFSNPSELHMNISITFKDEVMLTSFVKALMEIGYSLNEFHIRNNSVNIFFYEPYTKKVSTRNSATDFVSQSINKILCQQYQTITKKYKSTPEKLEYLQRKAPLIYNEVIKIGKPIGLYNQQDEDEKNV